MTDVRLDGSVSISLLTPVTPAARRWVKKDLPDATVLVDSRTHIADFRGVIAKPNHIEAGHASRELFGRVDYAALR